MPNNSRRKRDYDEFINNNNNEGSNMDNRTKYTIFGVAGFLFLTLMLTFAVSVKKIEGNERAVVQDWNKGVLTALWTDGTHFYVPLTTSPTVYNIGSEKFIMGKSELYNGVGSDFVDYPAFTITTGGSGKEQPATFSVTMNYRLDAEKLISLHKKARSNYEDLIIKPTLTRIISDLATKQTVLDFYSGEGRIKLQKDIENAITNHKSLSEVGIIVDTFVIDDISLDSAYVAEITGRQLATQKKLRAIEETSAAQEVAKRVEAEAQADKLKMIVQAEAKKQQKIKAAEADNESRILSAQAQAAEIKEKAGAERYRKEQDAKGLLAQGMAEAQVAEAKRNSKYSGESGERQAMVEIAKFRVGLFKNMKIKGILDKDVALTIISGASPALTLPVSGR